MRPGIRLKTHWFRDATPRDPAQIANALSATVWRTADVRLKNLRQGRFEIAAGADYAEFRYDENGPEFAFLRHSGNQLTDAMSDPDDRRWAHDQAMTVEGPECVDVIEKAMRGLPGLEPKPRRGREAGE